MFCRNCGMQLKDGAQFCTGCGSPAPKPVNTAAQPAAAMPQMQSRPIQTAPQQVNYYASAPAAVPQPESRSSAWIMLVLCVLLAFSPLFNNFSATSNARHELRRTDAETDFDEFYTLNTAKALGFFIEYGDEINWKTPHSDIDIAAVIVIILGLHAAAELAAFLLDLTAISALLKKTPQADKSAWDRMKISALISMIGNLLIFVVMTLANISVGMDEYNDAFDWIYPPSVIEWLVIAAAVFVFVFSIAKKKKYTASAMI